MSNTFDKSSIYTQLRDKAESQLKTGTTPTASHWSIIGLDVLRLLHQLSSDHEKADDALKLLHELQVHQVELDLQNEEIASNEQALSEDLQLYRTLYDNAPFAYCVVDLKSTVIRSNFAAAELFGLGRDELEGQRIDTFLKLQNRPQLLDLLTRVVLSGETDSWVTETGDLKDSHHLKFQASLAPECEQVLLVCCPCSNLK